MKTMPTPTTITAPDPRNFLAMWAKLRSQGHTPETWGSWNAWDNDRFDLPYRRRLVDRSEYWDGKSSLTGKTCFVDLEGGLGDIIHFGRCIPIIKAAGARIVIMLHPYFQRLTPLLRLCPEIDEIVLVDSYCRENVPRHDVALRAGSYPLVIPWNVPDAHWLPEVPQGKRERARAKIGGGALLKIGLSWASSATSRNLPLRSFAELATIPGVKLYGLQRGAEARELEGIGWVKNLEDVDGDIVDTAAAMCELDLVITVDSLTCHLAATLGRSTWTLLPARFDWRWGQNRTATPWYPTMHLFRQVVQGDWSGPVAEVMATVRQLKK